jgi:hypothetical protein
MMLAVPGANSKLAIMRTLSCDRSNQNLIHAMTPVKDAGIERRTLAWCRCIQLEEVTPDGA